MAYHPTSMDPQAAPTWRSRTTLTIPEAATVLGISRTTAYEAARRGDLPCLRLGGRRLVPVAQLIQLLDGVCKR